MNNLTMTTGRRSGLIGLVVDPAVRCLAAAVNFSQREILLIEVEVLSVIRGFVLR